MEELDKRRQYLPILHALNEFGGSARNRELNERVSRMLNLGEDELSRMMPNKNLTIFEYRAAWARTELKRSGAIDNPASGLWVINPKGRDWLELTSDAVVELIRKHRKSVRSTGKSDDADEPSEAASDGLDKWIDDLLEFLRTIDPGKFERLCQRILRESGFERVSVTNSVNSKDGGIDGHGELRINQLLSFKVLFQCKRYGINNWVRSSAIRDFRGAMQGRADKGLFITTSFFSRDAESEAVRDGVPNIELVDGKDLCMLLKHLSLGVKTIEIGVPEYEFFEDI